VEVAERFVSHLEQGGEPIAVSIGLVQNSPLTSTDGEEGCPA